MTAYVYILASQPHGTLYVGVTNDLAGRIYDHRNGLVPGFTAIHNVKLLVHYEAHDTLEAAIAREKKVKRWPRAWKVDLIEAGNPTWRDLYQENLS